MTYTEISFCVDGIKNRLITKLVQNSESNTTIIRRYLNKKKIEYYIGLLHYIELTIDRYYSDRDRETFAIPIIALEYYQSTSKSKENFGYFYHYKLKHDAIELIKRDLSAIDIELIKL